MRSVARLRRRTSHRAALPAASLAETQLQLGKPDRAVELIEHNAGGPDLSLVEGSFRPYFLELLARARLALGDRQGAERAAATSRDVADAVQLPLAAAWADRAAAAVALDAGDPQRAVELASRSVERATQTGAAMEAAIGRTVAGRALVAAGDRDGAVEQLTRAGKLGADSRVEVARQVEQGQRAASASGRVP